MKNGIIAKKSNQLSTDLMNESFPGHTIRRMQKSKVKKRTHPASPQKKILYQTGSLFAIFRLKYGSVSAIKRMMEHRIKMVSTNAHTLDLMSSPGSATT